MTTQPAQDKPAGKVIAYHGTSEKSVAAIKREGFRKGTYFAYRVEDALGFGGNHVFAVEFPTDLNFSLCSELNRMCATMLAVCTGDTF